MKAALVAVATAAILSGCATGNDWHWYKEGASQQEFQMDNGQCRAQALSGTHGVVNQGTVMIMFSCMEGKGWLRRPNK